MVLCPIFKVCAREKGYRGGGQAGLMVVTGGARKSSQGKLGGDLVGGQDKSEQEGHTVGDGSGDIRGRRAGGWRFWDRDKRCPGGWRTP